jgi:hypothetical protein
MGLDRLEGRVPTYYPPGAEARARDAQALLLESTAFFKDKLGVDVEITVALLTRPQWASLIRWQPYGIPGVAGTPPVVFLPATDDGLAAEDALGLHRGAGPEARRLLAEAGVSYEQAARRYVDLVALHELGHVLVRRLEIWPNSRWLDELLATYIGYAFMRERRPTQASVWDAVLQTYDDAVQPAHRSLADFDRLYFGVGARNYVWYQAQFQQLVRKVYAARGLLLLGDLRSTFSAPDRLPADPGLVVERLTPYMPGISDWARALNR